MEIECIRCGDTKTVPPSRSDAKFCGQDCYVKYQEETKGGDGVDIECPNCGQVNNWPESREGQTKFCNSDCYAEWRSKNWTGDSNPRWIGGHPRYYGENWGKMKSRVRERDGLECQECGIHESECEWTLEVHHITPIRTFEVLEEANTMENLVLLCPSCHRQKEVWSE